MTSKLPRKLQILFMLLFSITVLFILLIPRGQFQGKYHQSADTQLTHKIIDLDDQDQQVNASTLDQDQQVNASTLDQDQQVIASILSTMGYTLSDLPDRSELWTENVELCIMFNLNEVRINQEVVELLIAYYHPFFSHFTLLFNGDPAKTKRPKYLPSFVDVFGCDSYLGWYQHRCIRTCIQQGTNETKGFLYIADDMFINVSKMAELPSSKVWFVAGGIRKYSDLIEIARKKRPAQWWWGPPTNSAANLEIEINNLRPEWKDQLTKTAGFPDHFKAFAISDIIYVPRTIVPKLELVLTHIINTTKLFCEVATNLAVNIVAPDRVDFVNGYLWHTDRSVEGINKAALSGAHFVHPIKLGVKQHQDLWIQYMKKQLEIVIQRKRTNYTVHEQH